MNNIDTKESAYIINNTLKVTFNKNWPFTERIFMCTVEIKFKVRLKENLH